MRAKFNFQLTAGLSLSIFVAACSPTARMSPGPGLPVPIPAPLVATLQPPIDRTMTIDPFVQNDALNQMSDQDKIAASDAQFNALQFGRPGAPRNWTGTNGVTGKITVGPFIAQNGLDCRNFEHVVTIAGASHVLSATACRGLNNNWSVVG